MFLNYETAVSCKIISRQHTVHYESARIAVTGSIVGHGQRCRQAACTCTKQAYCKRCRSMCGDEIIAAPVN